MEIINIPFRRKDGIFMAKMTKNCYTLYTCDASRERPDKLVFRGFKDELVLFLQERYPKAHVTKRISRWQVSRLVEDDYLFYIDGMRQFGGMIGVPVQILKKAEN